MALIIVASKQFLYISLIKIVNCSNFFDIQSIPEETFSLKI